MAGSGCLTVDERATVVVLFGEIKRALPTHKEIVDYFMNFMGTGKKHYTVLFQKV
jgi:hypothetical protein